MSGTVATDSQMDELLRAWREFAWNREHMAAQLLQVVKIVARDVVTLADVSSGDPLRPEIVRRARARAERILADIGSHEEREKAH
jgi:hypothetical protein